MKGCATADATVPIYLLAGSFADPFPHSLIGREPLFSRRSDLVTPDMLFDFVMHRTGHFHAPIYVPEGPLDVVGCLSDSLDSVVEPHFCLPLQRKMQRVRKVYVCSSHRVAGDPNNFTMELKQDVDMGEKAHMAVTSTSIPHVFYGIQAGINNKLYIREFDANRVLEIESGNYTAASLANKLSAKLNATPPTGVTYTVTYSATTMKITIVQNGGQGLRVYTDQELKTMGMLGTTAIAVPASLNAILNHSAPFVGYFATWTSGVISLARITELYIRSPELATGYSTLDSNGKTDVLRKVHVDQDFGFLMTTDNQYETSDLHNVSGRTIRSFSVQLTDSYGTLIEMPQDWSFTLSFVYGDLE